MKRVCYLYHMNETQTPNTMTHSLTPDGVRELYATIERLEKALDEKHKQFVEQRSLADHFEMKYECKKAHECKF